MILSWCLRSLVAPVYISKSGTSQTLGPSEPSDDSSDRSGWPEPIAGVRPGWAASRECLERSFFMGWASFTRAMNSEAHASSACRNHDAGILYTSTVMRRTTCAIAKSAAWWELLAPR